MLIWLPISHLVSLAALGHHPPYIHLLLLSFLFLPLPSPSSLVFLLRLIYSEPAFIINEKNILIMVTRELSIWMEIRLSHIQTIALIHTRCLITRNRQTTTVDTATTMV